MDGLINFPCYTWNLPSDESSQRAELLVSFLRLLQLSIFILLRVTLGTKHPITVNTKMVQLM